MVVTLKDCLDQEGPASREREVLNKRVKDRMKKIRDLLVTLAGWNEQAGIPDTGLTLDTVLSNVLPWHTGGQYKDCSLDFLRLKLFKMESEAKRCEEELLYLPSDAVKALLYFGKQIRLLQDWLMKEHTPSTAPSGKVILMYERMQKVKRLSDDAFARFVKCKLLLE